MTSNLHERAPNSRGRRVWISVCFLSDKVCQQDVTPAFSSLLALEFVTSKLERLCVLISVTFARDN